jgi:nucleoside-diphosphate-sugar epimerase
MPNTPLHVILGANGVIGRETSRALDAAGMSIRQAGRSPEAERPTDALAVTDLLDPAAVDRAVTGAAVAYLVAGLRYDHRVWATEWPRVMDNCIAACVRHGTRLVFFDNVYAYGHVSRPMTEITPFNPCSRKGEVRAQIATTLLDTIARREITAMIVRAADFYGPDAVQSFTHGAVFERLRAGKTPQWIGAADAVHTFTFTPDAGRATAFLGMRDDAYGTTWHLPTSSEAITGREFIRRACVAAGQPDRVQMAPRWMLRLMGLLMPVLRENDEMMYQFEHDYRFDSSKIRTAFGLEATPVDQGIVACLTAGG